MVKYNQSKGQYIMNLRRNNMKKTTYSTTRYELYEDGFYVEVSKPKDVVEFYLLHKSYDHKMFIGSMSGYTTPSEHEEFISREAYNFFTVYWGEVSVFDNDLNAPCGCCWHEFDESMEELMKHDYSDPVEVNEGD